MTGKENDASAEQASRTPLIEASPLPLGRGAFPDCDDGMCHIPEPVDPAEPASDVTRATVYYVGDPMCSWCWGVSPAIAEVAASCAASHMDFRLVMGGLRAGGGDAWTPAFRGFLETEWRHIQQTTGQPFGLTLLDLPQFDYDTEPACRAVVTARLMIEAAQDASAKELAFFSAVQRRFYVDGEDPKEVGFYREICASLGLDFDRFRTRFEDPETSRAVHDDFRTARSLGVRAFPTLLGLKADKTVQLATGYFTADRVLAAVDRL